MDSIVDRLLDFYECFTLPDRAHQGQRRRSALVRWCKVFRPVTFRDAAQSGSAGLKLDRSYAVLARAPSLAVAGRDVWDLQEQLLLLDSRMGGPVGDARTFRRACRELVLASSGRPASTVAESAAKLYERLAETDDRADAGETEPEEQRLRDEVERLRVAYRDEWRGWIREQESQPD